MPFSNPCKGTVWGAQRHLESQSSGLSSTQLSPAAQPGARGSTDVTLPTTIWARGRGRGSDLSPASLSPKVLFLTAVIRQDYQVWHYKDGRAFCLKTYLRPIGKPGLFLVPSLPCLYPHPHPLGGQRPEEGSLQGGGPHDPLLSSAITHPSSASPRELRARSENWAINTAVLCPACSPCAARCLAEHLLQALSPQPEWEQRSP